MNDQALYRIGAVAHLTGLPTNTIRTWERRYAVVDPVRSESGGRRYTDDDVERLQLLRTLSGFGEAIGAIAELDNGALRERIDRHHEVTGPSADGSELRVRIDEEALARQVHQVGFADPRWSLCTAGKADVVVTSLESLDNTPERQLETLMESAEARFVLVVHTFSRRAVLTQLADAGARLVRGPLTAQHLERVLRDQLGLARAVVHDTQRTESVAVPTGEAPARRWSDDHLARFREMRSSVDCECPNHLSTLISSLNAFERYSRTCENETPEDAALHGRLAEGTARARALMEDLLHSVLVHDGVEI